jgi:hypothetical protein
MVFTWCTADPAVFYILDGEVGMIISIHVHDSFILSNSKAACAAVKHKIGVHYKIMITDLGPVCWLLGFEIRRDRAARCITMSQSTYIDALIECFHLTQAHPLSVPLNPHVDLYDANSNSKVIDATPYAKLTSSLMYVAIGTWPDIAYPVSTLTR